MPTVYSAVLADLGPRIVQATNHPGGHGAHLEGIGETYVVSRTVAGDVVQVLASRHLVQRKRRTGVRVRPRSEWDVYAPEQIRWRLDGAARHDHLRELTQLHAAVEPAAAALAARYADEDQCARVVRLAGLMESSCAAGGLATFLEHDVAFHRLLLQASGNTMFAALGGVVEEVLRVRTEAAMTAICVEVVAEPERLG